jgi:integrase
MAFTRRRVGKTGTERFLGIYIDLDGNERSAGSFPTQAKALREAQRVENKLAEGRAVERHRGKQTFGEYVTETWFPNHVIERSTRQTYAYLLDAHILPCFGEIRIGRIMPRTVREWVTELQVQGVRSSTIRQCKSILDAVFTTALNDQIAYLHAGRGVGTPPVAKKPKKIITVQQFEAIYRALQNDKMRLLVETDIESGLRWGELTELRVKDIDFGTGMLTVARTVVRLDPKFHPEGKRFLVKDYPKDGSGGSSSSPTTS